MVLSDSLITTGDATQMVKKILRWWFLRDFLLTAGAAPMASMAVILAVTAAAATAAAVGMELGPVGACVALGGVIAYKTNSKLYIAYIYDLLEICNNAL